MTQSMGQDQVCECGNCGRVIGALEQPYQWGDNLLCFECAGRISQQQSIAQPEQYQQPQNAVLFRHKKIVVKQSGIYDAGGFFPMHEVLSVRTTKGFLWGFRVRVTDLAGGSASYHFPGRGRASQFIAAIQSARGFINIELEDSGFFFILWW